MNRPAARLDVRTAGPFILAALALLGGLSVLTRAEDSVRPGWTVVVLGMLAAASLVAGIGALLLFRCGCELRHALQRIASREPIPPGRRLLDPLPSLRKEVERTSARLLECDQDRLREDAARVLEAERLATTGRLAAGVAHEINNPLGGILLCGDLLLESMAPGDPGRENVERIVHEAARARRIVRGLLDFARQTPAEMVRADLNDLVREVVRLLERQPLYQRARVRLELSPVPLWIEADPGQIQQVLVNVVMNGLEAMRPGGALTIRSGFSEKAGFCRVAVSDTGSGISPENLPRIFEPFFTTKEVGQGVGLGLAVSHGIVRQHGGSIEVQSALLTGTTFRILFPAREAHDRGTSSVAADGGAAGDRMQTQEVQ